MCGKQILLHVYLVLVGKMVRCMFLYVLHSCFSARLSLSLSIFLRFYIYIRICVVHTGSGEVFTPHLLLARSTSSTTERITNLSFAYLLPLNLLPSLSLFFRRSEPGKKELTKFLFSLINHSFGFTRAFDHGAPLLHFTIQPIDLFRTLTLD